MRVRIAFVLGCVVGYVLGTRAGRRRYEQIKGGALKVWNSGPVQGGVGAAQDFAQERANALLASVFEAGKNYFSQTPPAEPEQKPSPDASGGEA